MGGVIGVANFVTVGTLAYVTGFSRVSNDIPPFMIGGGDPARVRGVNRVGLSRWGFSEERIRRLTRVYRELFSKRATRSGVSILEKIEKLEADGPLNDDLRYLFAYLRKCTLEGKHGRYRESLRTDTAADLGRFYAEAPVAPLEDQP